MSFRRTVSGLSNLHLFYSTDYVVFVEGGKSYSIDDLNNGEFDNSSLDINFWKGIFCHYLKNEKFHFRSVGSKETLLSIVEDIQNGNTKNVYVAIDRDFDLIKNTLPNNKFILFTFGYSWENDVWCSQIIVKVLDTICSISNLGDDLKLEINSVYENFIRDISFAVCADAYGICSGRNGFIPRDKHLICLKFKKNEHPSVNKDKLNEFLSCFAYSFDDINVFGEKFNINPARDCFGHLVADFCYYLVIYVINKIKKLPSIPKHYVNCIGIDKFIDSLKEEYLNQVNSHYAALLAR